MQVITLCLELHQKMLLKQMQVVIHQMEQVLYIVLTCHFIKMDRTEHRLMYNNVKLEMLLLC